uniref:Uncharacterized protein n=1 Tax=Amphimedon queenslandica TaxID=400682 RepID=A0A1X7T6A2_AMPQE
VTDLGCSSTDTLITQCSFSHFTRASRCDGRTVAAIRCHNCTDGEIKIIPYSSYSKLIGRLEVCVNGVWGVICRDFFDDNDAAVACTQLGYSSIGSIAIKNSYYSGAINIDIIDLNCTGGENNISNCPRNALIGQHTCTSNYYYAGVACYTSSVNYTNCTTGQIRLSGNIEGRVELCYSNVWYGVCGDSYYSMGSVVCDSIGYERDTEYRSNFVDLQDIPLYPYEFSCSSNDNSLFECSKYVASCYSSSWYYYGDYAGVTCRDVCQNGTIRLSGSGYPNIGMVELCISSEWGTICRDSFDTYDASVVCKQLGYSPYGSVLLHYYSPSAPEFIYDLNCTGSEERVLSCPFIVTGSYSCSNYFDAAVICQVNTTGNIDLTCSDGDVRLIGGINDAEGRIEMCYNNFWGQVCDSSWDTTDANVLCRQLGYQATGATAFRSSYFGNGPNPHLISNVYCRGYESSLLSCSYSFDQAARYCGDGAVAGAACLEIKNCENGAVRLVNTHTDATNVGRVELCVENTWTTLCDESWDYKDAQVICRQLGFSVYGALPEYDCYTESHLSFGITELNCTGDEDFLLNCSYSNAALHNCQSHSDASVVCQRTAYQANCTNGQVRLVDGITEDDGRVEICISQAWGRLYAVSCNGNETSIWDCLYSLSNTAGYSCSQSTKAVIKCQSITTQFVNCTDGDVRLVGGQTENQGSVQICYNNAWTYLCSGWYWGTTEANTVCSQLGGFYSYRSVAYRYNHFNTPQNSPFVYGYFDCSGSETRLVDCYMHSYYLRYCYSYYIAGVTCRDINECQQGTSGCSHICTNTVGSYKCSCYSGYQLSNDSHTCIDIDECTEGLSGCSQTCSNTIGSYTCICTTGYILSGDSHSCMDINECNTDNGQCSSLCTNTIGSYICSCESGYILEEDEHNCTDINECLTDNGGCNYTCTNIPGSYLCDCSTGYDFDPIKLNCTDINECATENGGCEHSCTNTIGSFYCTCSSGFQLKNGVFCSDINECSQGISGCGQQCINVVGSYECDCNAGYYLASNNHSCLDVDECLGASGCNQICINTVGSYYCDCQSGYVLSNDLLSCNDINECNNSSGGCAQICQNTEGSYDCSCHDGYSLNADKHNCSDIDECGNNNGACEQVCTNTIGNYSCLCNSGFTILNRQFCSDINECSDNNGGCQQTCHNTAGSYYRLCGTGFTLDAISNCTDINECSINNGGCEQQCTNTVGSYYCACNSSYTLNVDNHMCDDIDECVYGTHGCNQNCTNTNGSYLCFCMTGYHLMDNHKICADTNECLLSNGGCSQLCVNTIGSYQCNCRNGYQLINDGYDCADINECTNGTNLCEHNCYNTNGSYVCDCQPGYQLSNGLTCSDINECDTNNGGCAQVCVNQVGSYYCQCNNGYTLDDDSHGCS